MNIDTRPTAGSDLTLIWLIHQQTLAFPETSQKCLQFHPCLTFTLVKVSVFCCFNINKLHQEEISTWRTDCFKRCVLRQCSFKCRNNCSFSGKSFKTSRSCEGFCAEERDLSHPHLISSALPGLVVPLMLPRAVLEGDSFGVAL